LFLQQKIIGKKGTSIKEAFIFFEADVITFHIVERNGASARIIVALIGALYFVIIERRGYPIDSLF